MINSSEDIIYELKKLSEGGAEENTFTQVGKILRWLKKHRRDFENGNLNPKNAPAPEGLTIVVMESVIFGLMWEREYPATDKKAIETRLANGFKLLVEETDKEDMGPILKRLEKFIKHQIKKKRENND